MAQFMRALKRFRYDKHTYEKGDMLEVKSRHAQVLHLARLAEIADMKPMELGPPVQVFIPPELGSPTTYTTREMEAKQPSAMTVLELREEADKRGISLPRGFIAKATLLDIIERA